MTYQNFISEIKRTQSQFEPTRKKATLNLGIFWQADSGKMFGKYMERMSFEHSEQQRQRRNRNRWS